MVDQQKIARDVMKLLQTIDEGLEYLNSRVQEQNMLDTSYFFDDIVSAVTAVVKSLQPILPRLCENQVLVLSDQLIAAMVEMTAGYEQKDEAKAISALQSMTSAFKAWHKELDRCLLLYTSC